MLLHIKIFLCIALFSNVISDYKVLLQGDVTKDGSCRLLLKDRRGYIAKKHSIKSFVICVKRKDQINDRPNCYTAAGNLIPDDFKFTVLNQLPHGSYQIVIRDIVCGSISENNTDIKHFRLKDFELEIQL